MLHMLGHFHFLLTSFMRGGKVTGIRVFGSNKIFPERFDCAGAARQFHLDPDVFSSVSPWSDLHPQSTTVWQSEV